MTGPGIGVATRRNGGAASGRGRIAAFATLGLAFGALGLRSLTFERRLRNEVQSLLAASGRSEPAVVSEADLARLPAPVRRWLRWSGVVGAVRPATIHLRQEGHFRLGERQHWLPFRAESFYTIDPPGFVWPARFQLAPLLPITGRDAYVGGQGSIDMRVLGAVPVAQQRGPALDQGALLRFLNETVWFPAAVLKPYITWEEVDASAARATIRHGGVEVSATVTFDDLGRPTGMVAHRYRSVADRFELTSWSTPFHEYGEFGGIRVPVAGEGVWQLARGDFPYIRLRVTALAYDASPLDYAIGGDAPAAD